MRSHPQAFDLDDVIQREHAEVLNRRRAAGVIRGEETSEDVARTLVGLSFSGGGIRSASFNLGLLQALYRHGLMRSIDLLSSVSGGSYVSARLVSEVTHPETRLDWEGNGTDHPALPEPESRPEPDGQRPHEGTAHVPSRDSGIKTPTGPEPRARGRTRRKRSQEDTQEQESPRRSTHGNLSSSTFALAPDPTGRQSPEVLEMIRGGRYLRHETLAGLNRWLIGIVLIGVVTFSGVLCLASLSAFLFRLLDDYLLVDWLYVLGFPSDVHRALFPACVVFVGWLFVWAIGYWRRGERVTGLSARPLLVLTIVSFLLAISALLGTGDIDINYLRNLFGIQPPDQEINRMQGWLQYLLPALLVILLLPYLRPRELIRSGTHPRNLAESWIFAIASRALLYGIPLLIFAFMARENLSKFNESRLNRAAYLHGIRLPAQSDLIWMDFKDWRSAWRSLEAEAKAAEAREAAEGPHPIDSRRQLSKRLWQTANTPITRDELQTLLGPHLAVIDRDRRAGKLAWPSTLLELAVHCEEENARLVRSLSFPKRWLLLVGLGVESRNALTDHHHYRVASRLLGEEVCRLLNQKVLREPALYEDAPSLKVITVRDPERASELELLIASSSPAATTLTTPFALTLETLRDEGADLEAMAQAENLEDGYKNWIAFRAQLIKVLTRDPNQGFSGRKTRETALNALLESEDAQNVRRREGVETGGGVGVGVGARASGDSDDVTARMNATIAQLPPGLRTLDAELTSLNRGLLQTVYPDLLKPRDTIFAYNVQPADQRMRLSWFAWALGLFLVSALLVNLNATSMHGYYRDELASMWIREHPGEGSTIPLVRIESTNKGAPYPIFGATISQLRSDQTRAKSPEDTFIFSPRFCGSLRTGFAATEDFQAGRFDLANAMAISGAALSPSYPNNPLVAVLLLLTNMRLGQWVPNPGYRGLPLPLHTLSERLPASPLRLLMDRFSKPDQRYHCFVADGGYVENLGLEQLLLRRCRLIIASDVSSDPFCLFSQFMEVVRRVRTEHGIVIRGLDDDPLTPDPEGLRCIVPDRSVQLAGSEETTRHYAHAHFAVAEIHYPPGQASGDSEPMTGWLILVKPSFTLDEGTELLSFWAEHPEFPNDPTTDQFYAADKFEAYRLLGFHIGERLAQALDGDPFELPDGSQAMFRAIRAELLGHWSDPNPRPHPDQPPPRSRRRAASHKPTNGAHGADLDEASEPSSTRSHRSSPSHHPAR
ncbi:hypothetical protein [Tautonia rosea]|uniref:hypothetical protein n=1 Tax=Tautonia rosea TaxID=2728037 RepID=UPI001475986B|nr:hypothetical protein [Tautonia rosea]